MTDPARTADAPDAPAADDRLVRISAQLDAIEQVPLDQRPELFESVNRALVDELSAMDAD